MPRGFGLGRAVASRHAWAGLLLVASATVGSAVAAPCLNDSQPIEGELQQLRTRSASGRNLSGYVLQLGGSACAEVTDLDGAPAQLLRVRTVQIIATDRTGESALERLLGARIRVIGKLDAPDPERHAGNAVLSNAQLVSVISRVRGGKATVAKAGAGNDYVPAAVSSSTGLKPIPDLDTTATVDNAAPSNDPDRAELEQRLAEFVENFYLSGEALEPDVIGNIYAPRVNYFGKRNTGVAAITKDKLAYYDRWPDRAFTLQPGSLEVRQVGYDGALYDLSFIYDFRVAAVGRERAGRGYGRLQVDLSDGEGKIVRESGKVIERN